ncbi:MAG: response regulator, partial [Candidatus Omnitrophota bacterium]|nr:response regulator [Candidatus Omnitrophota bacterium]
IKRGADIYRQVFDSRLKSWISTGKIKPGEVVVYRSGFSGWRKPEELNEIILYFQRYEKAQSRKIKRKKSARRKILKKKRIKSILIIDDEKDLCLLLGGALSSHGYNVQCVHTRKEAMSSLKMQAPDMVFCDLKLPDGYGMKILSKIRSISPSTIVSMITAYGSEEARDEARRLGAYSFIDKPFSEEDILGNIREFSKAGVS